MKTVELKASIILRDKGLIYNICTLIQKTKGESFSYTFIPNRNIIEILPSGTFEGIQGIDLDAKKEKYEREGIPTFVSERVPPKNREELYKLLEKVGLDYYDPLQFMIRAKQKYFGDNLEVVDFIQNQTIDVDYSEITNLYSTVKEILANIALNNQITINGNAVDNQSFFKTLYPVYLNLYLKKVEAQKKSAFARKYEGRRPIYINESEFAQILNLYYSKQISLNEAIRFLGISRSTFIRRAKMCQNQNNH